MQRKQKQIGLLGLLQAIEQGLLLRKKIEGILRPKGQPKIVEYSKIGLQDQESGPATWRSTSRQKPDKTAQLTYKYPYFAGLDSIAQTSR